MVDKLVITKDVFNMLIINIAELVKLPLLRGGRSEGVVIGVTLCHLKILFYSEIDHLENCA